LNRGTPSARAKRKGDVQGPPDVPVRDHATTLLHDGGIRDHGLDRLFHALADSTRRRLIDELAERDGQTLFELHVRMMQWHGASLTRQALSRHLGVLEEVGLLRCEWQWRSKFHFLELEPLRRASAIWLGAYLKKPDRKGSMSHAHRAHERARR
jgi:DNA-binding transcriptional ArsR family regulator